MSSTIHQAAKKLQQSPQTASTALKSVDVWLQLLYPSFSVYHT
jgi:hypothetical protein